MRSNTQGPLLSLPGDIMLALPSYVRDIEDFVSLTATCHLLHGLSTQTSPRIILRLAAAASKTFFRPDPYFLVAATARQLAEWASPSSGKFAELRAAFREGMGGLLELALKHAGLTMARIRELYEMRFSTINPVVDLIDKCVGEQWMEIPNFWEGGADDAATIVVDVPKTFFHIVIYGELFGPGLVAFIETGKIPEVANVDMRLEFIKYCIPDDYCWSHQFPRGNRNLKQSIDPRRAVDGVGPYVPLANGSVTFLAHERDNQEGLRHLLRSKRWNPP